MRLLNVFYSVLKNRCPRCHKGKVFEKENVFDIKHMFLMHPYCTHCNEKYEKEPGYFYGAMYVSYGLTAGWFMITYAIEELFLHLTLWQYVIPVSLSIIIFIPVTFRWSRLLWLNIFVKYNPKL